MFPVVPVFPVELLEPDEPEPDEAEPPLLWDGFAAGRELDAFGAAGLTVVGLAVLADAWVAPGSRTATTPAAATLATETAAVAEARRFRPRSRSATARATADGRVRN